VRNRAKTYRRALALALSCLENLLNATKKGTVNSLISLQAFKTLSILTSKSGPKRRIQSTYLTTQSFVSNYKTLVSTLSTGPDLPHIDEKFIHKCLDDMKAVGMIDDKGIL